MICCEVFQCIGGFDVCFVFVYYEDVDFVFFVCCFGLQVWYELVSMVVYCEGISVGIDFDVGMKCYQCLNQVKFVQKWVIELVLQLLFGIVLECVVCWYCCGCVLVVDVMMFDLICDFGLLWLCEILEIFDDFDWSVIFYFDDGCVDEVGIDCFGVLGCEVFVN